MNTKISHTPGPWRVRVPIGPCHGLLIVGINGEIVGNIHRGPDQNLISAAPDLLAELKRLHEKLDGNCCSDCRTLDIIAKAEGMRTVTRPLKKWRKK